jgi:hypothetical protein
MKIGTEIILPEFVELTAALSVLNELTAICNMYEISLEF